jgi:hypothetical protein
MYHLSAYHNKINKMPKMERVPPLHHPPFTIYHTLAHPFCELSARQVVGVLPEEILGRMGVVFAEKRKTTLFLGWFFLA